MRLYLFRHGIAEDTSPDGSDFSRPLTREGVDKTRRAAGGLARLIDPPDRILSSPRLRALETARLAAEVFGRDVTVESCLGEDALDPIFALLRQCHDEAVMLVGHEPTFSRLAEMLCTPGRHGGFIQLKKAGCIALETIRTETATGLAAMLTWLATPAMLRKLARGA